MSDAEDGRDVIPPDGAYNDGGVDNGRPPSSFTMGRAAVAVGLYVVDPPTAEEEREEVFSYLPRLLDCPSITDSRDDCK